MPPTTTVGSDERTLRDRLVSQALVLSYVSVIWGVVSGAWSVTAGLLAGSLGVLGVGLSVVGDVVGSAGLVWRFRVERGEPDRAHRAEDRISLVVAGALVAAAVILTIEAVHALAAHSGPSQSLSAMLSAGAAALVLAPLGLSKRRVGAALHSYALRGDGALSIIGAVLGVLALLGLLADRLFGWWWADRVAALVVAALAAGEAVRVLTRRSPMSAKAPAA